MPLQIVWFCSAVDNPEGDRSEDLDAYRFLTSLKGRKIQGSAFVPVEGQRRQLDNSNLDDAIDWFGEMVAAYLRRHDIRPPLGLVPIPDPGITLESSTGPWTSLLCMSIATKLEGDVETFDILRWKKGSPQGGLSLAKQKPSELYRNLSLIRKVEWTKPAILVGYLTTGAGVVQACAARLRGQGALVVQTVFAGRIVKQSSLKPFLPMKTEVADFHPTIPT
jgi:hypothetical protein